ncbi:MAG: hypothetical protein ACK6DC_09105, partial [Planctomycetota bacterium]
LNASAMCPEATHAGEARRGGPAMGIQSPLDRAADRGSVGIWVIKRSDVVQHGVDPLSPHVVTDAFHHLLWRQYHSKKLDCQFPAALRDHGAIGAKPLLEGAELIPKIRVGDL